jgi:L-aminopeptidase/D-esterase-like protein
VGHAGDDEARTGCTVVLGPFRAAADIRGSATGTREIEAISPRHLVERADAILLTGGSAFGLAAVDGVMAWLEERRDYGFDTGVGPRPHRTRRRPLRPGRGPQRPAPDAAMGRAACEAAGNGRRRGPGGAGTGATVGKPWGRPGPCPGAWAPPP